MRKLASEHGLEIGAIHAPSLLLTRRIWGTDPIGKIERAAEVAADAGVPTVVTHPPYRWQRAYRQRLHETLPRSRAAPASRSASRTCSRSTWDRTR